MFDGRVTGSSWADNRHTIAGLRKRKAFLPHSSVTWHLKILIDDEDPRCPELYHL
jgi:hypothetical protein